MEDAPDRRSAIRLGYSLLGIGLICLVAGFATAAAAASRFSFRAALPLWCVGVLLLGAGWVCRFYLARSSDPDRRRTIWLVAGWIFALVALVLIVVTWLGFLARDSALGSAFRCFLTVAFAVAAIVCGRAARRLRGFEIESPLPKWLRLTIDYLAAGLALAILIHAAIYTIVRTTSHSRDLSFRGRMDEKRVRLGWAQGEEWGTPEKLERVKMYKKWFAPYIQLEEMLYRTEFHWPDERYYE